MYPYIIMKLSKKKIQKLYKSKNQTRKSGGKKSFAPKQNNQRSRKAGALNLRKRTLRKMKGGVTYGEGGETPDVVKATPVVEEVKNPLEAQKVKAVVEAPEGEIVITKEEIEKVFEGFTKAREGENKESVANKLTATDDDKAKEEKIVSFNNLSTYKEFMTKLANLMLGKLNEVYNKKISDMKEELLKNIEEKDSDTAAQDESVAVTSDPSNKNPIVEKDDDEDEATGNTGSPEDKSVTGNVSAVLFGPLEIFCQCRRNQITQIRRSFSLFQL